MTGWHGRLLNVDLSQGRTWTETLPLELLENYLGGRGLGVRLLRDFYRLDPFSADLPLVFAVGPLCGTAAPTAARMSVVSRSPLTMTISDASCGGRFAWRLKASGFDALKITGQSPSPQILHVSPHEVKLSPADSLWGAEIGQTTAALAGQGSVAAIGPAGESLVRFAGIMTGEGNAAGRGGLGAVMGSKRLKAIVVNGDCRTEVSDPQRFSAAQRDIMRLFNASPIIFGDLGLAEYGTPAFVDLTSERRMAPTANFSKTWFAGAGSYSGPAIRKTYQPQKDGCYGCPIQCKKSTAEGKPLPEYETVNHFGALNNISDLGAIVAANDTCNRLGMDTVSAAATLAAWGECRNEFPAAEQLPELLGQIARREGIGDLLAEGAQRLTGELGKPQYSMCVKGLELPAYDPRGAYGMALAYCTSNRGGCHLRAYPISHEILRKPVATDRFDFAGKARMIKIAEDNNAIIDSLVACKFAFLGAGMEEYNELLVAATGCDYTPGVLQSCGERIYLTERFYNQQNGFTAEDDFLPERFFLEPGSSGTEFDIPPLDRERFLEELQRYYRIRGLDRSGRLPGDDFLERQP